MGEIKVGDAGQIGVIDFAPFLDGSRPSEVGEAMIASLRDTGFVYLVNHGLSGEKIKSMFEWSKKFFAQPMEIKQLAPHPPSGTHHRGYSAPGVEVVVQHKYDAGEIAEHRAKASDVKESFEVGREEDDTMPNILLPDGVLPGFNEACLEFFWTYDEVSKTVLRALALGLGLAEDYFVKVHTAPDNQLRLLHYPSVPAKQLQNDEIVRIGAHSDFGSITLLLQDEVGGLEVEDPNKPGHFQSAPPVEGSIIINAGDLLMRWSNDLIRSTVHRVRAPPDLIAKDGMTPERYSIPYFCCVDFDTVIDCIPGTFGDNNPKKYKPITPREYVLQRLAANY